MQLLFDFLFKFDGAINDDLASFRGVEQWSQYRLVVCGDLRWLLRYLWCNILVENFSILSYIHWFIFIKFSFFISLIEICSPLIWVNAFFRTVHLSKLVLGWGLYGFQKCNALGVSLFQTEIAFEILVVELNVAYVILILLHLVSCFQI